MSTAARPRAAALVSGGGTTALNLIEQDRAGVLGVSVSLVIAHRTDIPAVERCREAGCEVVVVEGPPCAATSDRVDELLGQRAIDLVLLAGYLRHFRVGPWRGRVLNIHPALLPSFGGKGMHGDRVHEEVLASGASRSGCTVHFVDDEYDHGETVLMREVSVDPTDTVATLSARVRGMERIAYPEAIRMWVAGRRSHDSPL